MSLPSRLNVRIAAPPFRNGLCVYLCKPLVVGCRVPFPNSDRSFYTHVNCCFNFRCFCFKDYIPVSRVEGSDFSRHSGGGSPRGPFQPRNETLPISGGTARMLGVLEDRRVWGMLSVAHVQLLCGRPGFMTLKPPVDLQRSRPLRCPRVGILSSFLIGNISP